MGKFALMLRANRFTYASLRRYVLPSPTAMSNKFIVTFKDGASKEQIDKAKDDLVANGGKITQVYDMPGMKGFAGYIPDSFMSSLQSLQGNLIDSIEPDGEFRTQ